MGNYNVHCTNDCTNDAMWLLIKALDRPETACVAARRLLSDYNHTRLGSAVYQRCKRVLNPPGDPVRILVAPGKPGRLNSVERREYQNREVVENIKRMVGT